jgi:Recombinase
VSNSETTEFGNQRRLERLEAENAQLRIHVVDLLLELQRGVKLGGPKLAEAREAATASIKALADRHAANVLPIIREIQRAGATSLHQIADALNARGISTPRGGQWYAKSVSNLLARA